MQFAEGPKMLTSSDNSSERNHRLIKLCNDRLPGRISYAHLMRYAAIMLQHSQPRWAHLQSSHVVQSLPVMSLVTSPVPICLLRLPMESISGTES
jgi:hypothetical protein